MTLTDALSHVLKYSLGSHEGFHGAIHENPQDHTAHLVYADWLQEQGHDEAAEHIRKTVADGEIEIIPKGEDVALDGSGPFTPSTTPYWAGKFRGIEQDGSPGRFDHWYAQSAHDPESMIRWVHPKPWRPGQDEPEKHRTDAVRYTLADEGDFHREIRKNPTDHLNHLGYADWLRENGREGEGNLIEAATGPTGTVNYNHKVGSDNNRYFQVFPEADGHRILLTHGAADAPKGKIEWSVKGLSEDEARTHTHALIRSGAKPVGPTSKRLYLGDAFSLNETLKNSADDAALRYETDHPADLHLDQFSDAMDRGEYHRLPGIADRLLAASPEPHHVRRFQNYLLPRLVRSWSVIEGASPDDLATLRVRDREVAKGAIDRVLGTLKGPFAIPDSYLPAQPVKEGPPLKWKPGVGRLKPHLFGVDDEPVRYGLVKDHDIHPDYAPTGIAPRIGVALNHIAAENSDAGALAEGIIRTGDHSLLKILADKLDDDGHPAAQDLDWRHAERGIKIDKAVKRWVDRTHENNIGYIGTDQRANGILSRFVNGHTFPRLNRQGAIRDLKKVVPDATKEDFHHSLIRLAGNEDLDFARQKAEVLGDPVPQDVPEWIRAIHDEHLNKLGGQVPNPHEYSDTRPPEKRVYAAEKLFRSPSGGMVVKESPLAVVGQFKSGGTFTGMPDAVPEPTPKPTTKPSLRALLKRLKWK